MFLYGSRLFISIADMCGYVYTPEVYPTSMRGIGLGACSGAARIGCIITPFVAMVSSEKKTKVSKEKVKLLGTHMLYRLA